MEKSSVYVLTNPCLRDVKSRVPEERGRIVPPVKVGRAKDVPRRLGNLNTPMTENFIAEMQVDLEGEKSAKALEDLLHEILSPFKIKTTDGSSTEFYACSVAYVRKKVKKWADKSTRGGANIFKPNYVGRSAHTIRKNLKRAGLAQGVSSESAACENSLSAGSAKVRAKAFQFAMLTDVGIKIGSELVFVPDGKKVKVASLKNKIEFEGGYYTTSSFCRHFMPPEMRNSKAAYQGPKYFTFNGELLTDLRAKLEK